MAVKTTQEAGLLLAWHSILVILPQ